MTPRTKKYEQRRKRGHTWKTLFMRRYSIIYTNTFILLNKEVEAAHKQIVIKIESYWYLRTFENVVNGALLHVDINLCIQYLRTWQDYEPLIWRKF